MEDNLEFKIMFDRFKIIIIDIGTMRVIFYEFNTRQKSNNY